MPSGCSRTMEGAVIAMGNVVERRDPYTAGHERRVAELAVAVALRMGMDGEELEALRLAALIHDVGKISVPAEILSKPGRLNVNEFELIKVHAQAGHDVLQSIAFDQPGGGDGAAASRAPGRLRLPPGAER